MRVLRVVLSSMRRRRYVPYGALRDLRGTYGVALVALHTMRYVSCLLVCLFNCLVRCAFVAFSADKRYVSHGTLHALRSARLVARVALNLICYAVSLCVYLFCSAKCVSRVSLQIVRYA